MHENQIISAESANVPLLEQGANVVSDTSVAQIVENQQSAEHELLDSATKEFQSVIQPLLPPGTIIEHAELLSDEKPSWNSTPFRVRITGKPDHIFLLLKRKDATDVVKKLTHLQPLLSEIDATVPGTLPQIVYSSSVPPVFLGYLALPGQSLNKIVDHLQPEDGSSLVKTMAETLSAVHSVPLEKAKQHGVKEEDLVGKYEYYFGEEFLSKEIRPMLVDAEKYDALHAYAARALKNPDFMNYRSEFIHGDLGSGNVLFDTADWSVGIIDWEHASISDADKDIHNFCRKFPPDLQEAFLQKYPMRNTKKPKEKMLFLDLYRALILVSIPDENGLNMNALKDLKEAISKVALV